MGQTSGQPSYGQAPTNGPMPGGNPALGGANMPSMQGPAVNVPAMYAALAGGNSLADVYMQMPQGGGADPRMPAPDSRMRAPMPGGAMGQPGMLQRPPMQSPHGGMPPMQGMMPGIPPGGGGMPPQIPPEVLAALQARQRPQFAGTGGGAPPGMGMLDLLGAGAGRAGRAGAGRTGGDPTRRRV